MLNNLPQISVDTLICGVVEGFYGRPWTIEQRKRLFSRMKQFGMNTYLYAPKDDSKHRAYWRDLYCVEEAEALRELINTSIYYGINFVYAISPGLDITYSSQKDQSVLKRKLEQVKEFGCKYFAILFDDIDSEMQQTDKTQFKSFAEAQSYLTNELYQYLNEPQLFFFCPTEYCFDMIKKPFNLYNSEYLSTIGHKLLPHIRIMWTGPKVVSARITIKHLKDVEMILKRKPLIWDNYHANDYDLKRVFLGPYSSRSTNIKNSITGVLTNPNCEYECNYVPIYTLALWSHSTAPLAIADDEPTNEYAKNEQSTNDIYETVLNELDVNLTKTHLDPVPVPQLDQFVYDLNTNGSLITYLCVKKWRPKFYLKQTQVEEDRFYTHDEHHSDSTTTTTTATTATGNGCGGGDGVDNSLSLINLNTKNKAQAAAINSLIIPQHQDNEVQTEEQDSLIQNLIQEQRMEECDYECEYEIATTTTTTTTLAVVATNENTNRMSYSSCSSPMSSSSASLASLHSSIKPPLASNESLNLLSPMDLGQQQQQQQQQCREQEDSDETLRTPSPQQSQQRQCELESETDVVMSDTNNEQLNEIDVKILMDLHYLPFQYGAYAIYLLKEFHLLQVDLKCLAKPDTADLWLHRLKLVDCLLNRISQIEQKLYKISNRELLSEIYSRFNELNQFLQIISLFLNWLKVNYNQVDLKTPETVEPWVYRGGLITELRRIFNFEQFNDMHASFVTLAPQLHAPYRIRLCKESDYDAVYKLYGSKPQDDLVTDRLAIGAYLQYSLSYCFLIENYETGQVCGCLLAAPNVRMFLDYCHEKWIPVMCGKYPRFTEDNTVYFDYENLTQNFHDRIPFILPNDYICDEYPSVCVFKLKSNELSNNIDLITNLFRQLLSSLCLCLRTKGSTGLHTQLTVSVDDVHSEKLFKKFSFTSLLNETNDRQQVFLMRKIIQNV